MMELYPMVKWLHIVSATVLFGTGLGTAFHLWITYRGGDPVEVMGAARSTVLADWVFTLPSGIVQPITGAGLVVLQGYDWLEPWLVATYVLYAIAFGCWARVVWLQIQVKRLATRAVAERTPLPPRCSELMRAWFWLGWPAFLGLLAVFYLMVARPGA